MALEGMVGGSHLQLPWAMVPECLHCILHSNPDPKREGRAWPCSHPRKQEFEM